MWPELQQNVHVRLKFVLRYVHFVKELISSIKSFIPCKVLLATDASAHFVISQNYFCDLEIVKAQKAYSTLCCLILRYDEDTQ